MTGRTTRHFQRLVIPKHAISVLSFGIGKWWQHEKPLGRRRKYQVVCFLISKHVFGLSKYAAGGPHSLHSPLSTCWNDPGKNIFFVLQHCSPIHVELAFLAYQQKGTIIETAVQDQKCDFLIDSTWCIGIEYQKRGVRYAEGFKLLDSLFKKRSSLPLL